MATVEWPTFAQFHRQLAGLVDPDFTPLMEDWVRTVIEGNRRGVLSGLDGYDKPMPALKYRTGAGKKTRNRNYTKAGNPNYKGFGTTVHYASIGAFVGGGHTTADYLAATGPRLAPFGERSRIITNLFGGYGRDGQGNWYIDAAWFEVVSAKGVPFLKYHFNGEGRNPKYDLRPVREADKQLAGRQARAFVLDLIRSQ